MSKRAKKEEKERKRRKKGERLRFPKCPSKVKVRQVRLLCGARPQLIYPPINALFKGFFKQGKLLPDGYMLGDGAKTPTRHA